MPTIAHTAQTPEALECWVRAFPTAEFVYAPLDRLDSIVREHNVGSLIVGGHGLTELRASRIAVSKARHLGLIVLAHLATSHDLPRQIEWLRRSHADGFLIAGVDDHPERLRQVFASAAVASVAYALERASSPSPPLLAAPNLERAVHEIGELTTASRLAAALGAPLTALRAELHETSLPSPKRMLAWIRLASAGRQLGDTDDSVEHISRAVGYGSATALRNVCHELVGAAPHEVRVRGGLRFLAERYRAIVTEERARAAA